jgi:UV excision repair protein RAD23
MGFPENEVRAALLAAMGNPDLAYEFLLTGIPEGANIPVATIPAAAPASGGAVSIESLRQHPQFNMLKQLVQQNPAALSQVLDLIGTQNPALLAAIHANNEAFIAMMNEPISDVPAPAATAAQPVPAGGLGGMGAGNSLADPAQMIHFLAALPLPQRAQFAQQLGMSPEQLESFMGMMATLPPDQLRVLLSGAGGMGAGAMEGAGGRAEPPNIIR